MKPDPLALAHLRPRNTAGLQATALALAATAAALALAAAGPFAAWALGQLVLALAFLQWFVLLHEAGHRTLFASRSANRAAGYVAGTLALVPFFNWSRIHARHHRYTGWQDLDATTALLVPRALGRVERAAMNTAWALGLPLFSLLYRLQNFWHVPRIARFLTPAQRGRAWLDVASLALAYAALTAVVGPWRLAALVGPGLLLSLAAQDLILLSQHTHMPRHLSAGGQVKPFAPLDQEAFTRSMRLPEWLSRLLLRFDHHELHHMYVRVPGYDLHRIAYHPQNEVHWLAWLRAAKRLSGAQFLFGRREETGFLL